jgi:phenylalanyl-tRNA synthetase beta chain
VLASFAEHIAGQLVISPLAPPPVLFGRDAVSFTIGDTIRGQAGRLSEALLNHLDIKSIVYYAELAVSDFLAAPPRIPVFRPLPRFPSIEWNLCFVMDEKIRSAAIADEIAKVSPLIEEVQPIDLFKNEKIGDGNKSIAYSVLFRSGEKTLTATEAQTIASSIIKNIEMKFNAKLRA